MSKEQTPITADEILAEFALVAEKGKCHHDLESNIKVCKEIAIRYANAKVLEALERDRKQFGDFLLNRRSEELSKGVVNFMRPVTCRDIEYYETEVKPKYK